MPISTGYKRKYDAYNTWRVYLCLKKAILTFCPNYALLGDIINLCQIIPYFNVLYKIRTTQQ